MSEVGDGQAAPGAEGPGKAKGDEAGPAPAMWATWEPRLTDQGVELDLMKDDSPEIIQAKVRVALLKAQIAMLAALPVVQVDGYEDVDHKGKSVPVPPVPLEHMPLVAPLEAPPPVTAVARQQSSGSKAKRRRNFAAPDPDPDAYDFATRGLTAGPHGLGLAVVDALGKPPRPVTSASLTEAGPRYSGQVMDYDSRGQPLPHLAGLFVSEDAPEELGGRGPRRMDASDTGVVPVAAGGDAEDSASLTAAANGGEAAPAAAPPAASSSHASSSTRAGAAATAGQVPSSGLGRHADAPPGGSVGHDRDDVTVGSEGLPALLGTPLQASGGPGGRVPTGGQSTGGGASSLGQGSLSGFIGAGFDPSQAPSRLSQVSLTDSTGLAAAAAHAMGGAPVGGRPPAGMHAPVARFGVGAPGGMGDEGGDEDGLDLGLG